MFIANSAMSISNKTFTYEQALFKASAYCATAEHCEHDVCEKMRAWNIQPETAEKIIACLKEENFLNEQRFCNAFVRDKFRFNQWGKIKIALMLRAKKVSSEAIETALAQIDGEKYAETLETLLRSKLKGLKFRDEYDRQAKLVRFAQSRGFEYDVISDCLDRLK